MIIKRKKVNRYQPNGYDETENIEKNAPGFHSTSTSYKSYKTFSDDDLARDKQDLQNYIVGGGLGVGAGIVGGKILHKKLDKRTLVKAAKENGISLEDLKKKHDVKIDAVKKQRLDRDSTSIGKAILDFIDGEKDKKRDLERYDKEIKRLEDAKSSEVNSYIKKIENKLERNRKIGKGVGIGGALALGGLGIYEMHKHNQKARGRKNHGAEEENDITSALRNSSDMVASGKLNPRFHKFHNLPKEKKETPITETKKSIINSLKSGNTDDLKDKFNKFRDTVVNAPLIKNIGNGLKSGFSGFGDNIKRNILGNDK